jgi:hypothetical protein
LDGISHRGHVCELVVSIEFEIEQFWSRRFSLDFMITCCQLSFSSRLNENSNTFFVEASVSITWSH